MAPSKVTLPTVNLSKKHHFFLLMKLQTRIFTAAAALLLTTVAHAQVAFTDIGTAAPTPGALDISQLLSNTGTGGVPGLNYYWDDGRQHATGPGYLGQTFTTLANTGGYVLTSLALKTGGNGSTGSGDTFPTTNQAYALAIYQLSGTGLTNATLLTTFTATGSLTTEGDWVQFTGLGLNLEANATYAYGFGITAGDAEDWELLATATNLPYAGGQACEVVNAGGLVTYSTSNDLYDATFDLGLIVPGKPIAPFAPTESTDGVTNGAGTIVTLTAPSAAGLAPISYLWQTDGGTGLTPTNIPAATGTNLVVNTTGWAPGTYIYDYAASNSVGVGISPTAMIVIVPIFMEDTGTTNAPTPGPSDISQLVFTPGYYNPSGFNYYTDNGAGHSEWSGQSFTTGSNADGYVMNSLAWKSGGGGASFPLIQLYDFYVFSISNTIATAIATNQGYGGGTESNWFKFVGLNVTLAPNTLYAYAFGRDATATGYESIGSSSNNPGLYTGGQVVTIFPPATGGTVTYGTGTEDATFDIGLTLSTVPSANLPTYTPDVTPIYAGTTVTLNENPIGQPPLTFQWLADNGTGGVTWTAVGGATTTNLVVNTTSLTLSSYEYEVIVKNTSGSVTSAPVTLTINPASEPIIVTDTSPSPDEDYVGETTTFSATFAGTLPITYQWFVNTGSGFTAISSSGNPSATNDTLVLANLQAANAGSYYLSASNSIGGPVTSTPATLTVLVDPTAPASGTVGALILTDGPLGYWPLNETGDTSTGVLPAYDASGNNLDGVYGVDSTDGIPGPTPSIGFPGFSASNTALQPADASVDSDVTLPSLNIPSNSVTITAWIEPTLNQATYTGLFFTRNFNNSDSAGLGFGGTENASGMPALGYTWNSNSAATYGFDSGLFPLLNQWSFVALVIQPSDATLYLYYIDPVTTLPDLYSATSTVTNQVETFSRGTGSALGTNAIGGDPYSSGGRAFNGNIDQVAVFDTAFTSSQILALFTKATGIGPVAPSISSQPVSKGAYAGTTVTFSAGGINGTSPFSYQWQLNGTNISGATNVILTLSDVTAADEGTYGLLVQNSVSTTPSSNATLTVVTPVPGSYESAVLKDNPLAFWRLNETNANPALGGVLAFEDVSGFTGTYQINAQDGWNGVLGPQAPEFPGFPSNNTALETFNDTTGNSFVIGGSAGTALASNLTYTMWINPYTNVEEDAGLLMDRGGAGEGFCFDNETDANTSSPTFGMAGLGYVWNQNSQDTWGWNTQIHPPTNQWSFVAMVICPTNGGVYMFNASGVQYTNNAIAHDTEEFGVAWHIGSDAADGNDGDRTFPGSISSVGVYLSALTSNQLTTLYGVGAGTAVIPPTVTLYIAKATAGDVTLTWSAGSLVQATNLIGPWITNTAAVSPYTVAVTNTQTFFEVK
jgi:hypothetical protein